jgi:hypothetical protein
MVIRLTIQSSPIDINDSKQMLDFPSVHVAEKEPQSFSHCNSFDQHALHLLNGCIFVLILPIEILAIWGFVIYFWKGLENAFPTMYYTRAP